jgi:hypothetical protein
VFFEFIKRLLDLLLLDLKNIGIFKVFRVELDDRVEHLHEFPKLEANEICQSE